jgi:hypothetical protein
LDDVNATLSYDGCTALNPAITATGSIVIFAYNPIKPGCGTSTPCKNAFNAGAVGCVMYNKLPDRDLIIDGTQEIPGGGISLAIARLIRSGNSLRQTISFGDTNRYFQNPTGSTVSYFSSLGLTPDLKIKPDFGALGGNVLSTISYKAQESQKAAVPYAVYSGTGLSSAYMAGSVAVYMDYYANAPYDLIQQVFQNTALPQKAFGSDHYESVAAQGGGLINVWNAIQTNILAAPRSLSLGGLDTLKKFYVLNITNYLPTPATYNITVEHALMLEPYKGGETSDLITRSEGVPVFADVKFRSRGSARLSHVLVNNLGYLKTARIRVSFIAPNVSASTFPIYSGFIKITNVATAEAIRVPFAGMAALWGNAKVWSRKNDQGIVTGVYNSTMQPIPEGSTLNATSLIPIGKGKLQSSYWL